MNYTPSLATTEEPSLLLQVSSRPSATVRLHGDVHDNAQRLYDALIAVCSDAYNVQLDGQKACTDTSLHH